MDLSLIFITLEDTILMQIGEQIIVSSLVFKAFGYALHHLVIIVGFQ